MLRHTVLLTWNDDVTDDRIEAVASELDDLVGTIPAIAAYHHGRDLGIAEGNADYAIVADFATVADYEGYRDDPGHQGFITRTMAPLVARRVAVQYSID